MSRRHAWGFASVAFAFWVVMLGATLPTPLYPLYERGLGFGELTTTLVFAAYAVGVIAALLLLGRASDTLGRRRLMLLAVVTAALSTLVFVVDPPLAWLFVARLLSGVSAGVVTGTATVYLVELVPEEHSGRASLAATVVNMLGLGTGPPLAGSVSELAPHPLVLPYAAHLALLVPALIGVLLAPETVDVEPGRPRVERPSVAREARSIFVPAAIAGFTSFAVLGLVTSVTSGILAQVLGMPDRALAGGVVFALFGASAVAQVVLAPVPTRLALRLGCIVLVAGLAVLVGSLLATSLVLLVLALMALGVGQALCFRAGVAAITEKAPPEQLNATITSFFLVAYVGISLPVVAVGALAAAQGLKTSALVFSGVVALLALVALALLVRVDRAARTDQPEGQPAYRQE